MKKYFFLTLAVILAASGFIRLRGQAPPEALAICVFRNDSVPWGGILPASDCQYSSNRDTAIYGPGTPVFTLHLILHIVRDDFGNGTGPDEVAAWMNLLHENFRGISAAHYSTLYGLGWASFDTGIDFTYETYFHDSTALLYAPYAALPPLSTLAPGKGPGLHIYTNLDHSMLLGLGSMTWVFGTTVNGYDQSFTHELGHRLFLRHTFPDQMFDAGYCSLKTYETMNLALMTIKQRDSVVDQCSDTEPDFAQVGCGLPGTVDCGGYPLNYLVRNNFMSYAGNACEVRFTHQQNGRMRCYIQNAYAAELSYGAVSWTEPIADFRTSLHDIVTGSTVRFADSSFGAVSYLWQFGDGGLSTLANPVHNYVSAGSYDVTLTVQDAAGNENSHTKRNAIRVSDGYALPYSMSFSTFPALTGGWSSLDSSDNIYGWRALNRIRYNPYMYVSLGPMDLGFPQTSYDACGPSYYYQNIIGHAGTATEVMFPQSKMQNGAAVDKDVMTSPVISLATSGNPVLRFWWSHIPSADANTATECPVDYPGAPYVCSVPTCTNPLNPSCGWPTDTYIGNRMQVMLSSDMGTTWVTLWDKTGADLNTVASESCVQFHYVPTSGSMWAMAEVDLCAYAGKQVLVKWIYFNDYASGNLFLDDVSFTGAGTTIAATIASTPDVCGDSSGTVTVNLTSPGNRVISLLRDGSPVSGPLALTGTSFTWPGLTGGNYVVVITDSSGCASLAETLVTAFSISGTLSMTASQCELENGTVTLAAPPSGASSWYFTLQDTGGVILAGPDTVGIATHTFAALSSGTYTVLLRDDAGGCFEGSIYVPLTGMTGLAATTTPETCFGEDGSLILTSPVGSFYYSAILLPSGTTLSNLSGYFEGLEGGDYAVYVTDSAGTCGYDTFTVVNPGTLTGHITAITGTCFPAGKGEMAAYLPSPIPGSTYIYYLLASGLVVDSSGTVPTPANYWTFSVYPGLYEMVIEGYGAASGLCLQGIDSVSVLGSGMLSFTVTTTTEKCNASTNTITITTSFPAGTDVRFTITPVGGVPISGIPVFTPPSTYQYTFSGLASGDYAVFANATDTFSFSHCRIDTLTIAATAPCCTGAGSDYTAQDESAGDLIAWFGSGPVITGKRISVNGVLSIDTDITFVNCILYMAPGASLNVEPHRYLGTFSSTHFLACGDTMWSGIYVQDSGFIEADLLLITDAENALSMEGGGYYVTNSRFDLNYKHILISEPLYERPLSPMGMQGNLFDCSSPAGMLYPHAGKVTHTGIEITNLTGLPYLPVIIGDSGLAPNVFRYLERGIVSKESDVRVWNNQFEDIVLPPLFVWGPGIPPPGRAVYASGIPGTAGTTHSAEIGLEFPGRGNTFINCSYAFETEGRMYTNFLYNVVENAKTAFWAHGVHGTGAWAEGNKITDTRLGLRVTFCSGSEVILKKNQINALAVFPKMMGLLIEDAGPGPATGYYLAENNSIELTGTGILVQSAEHVRLSNNYIRLGSLPGSQQGGIRASASPGISITENILWGTRTKGMRGIWLQYSDESIVQCNDLHLWGSALVADGHNLGSALRENILTACDTGLVYLHDGKLGRQGAPGSPAGNRWMGSGWAWKVFRNENPASPSLPGCDSMYVRNNAVNDPSFSNSSTAPTGPVFPEIIITTQGSNKIFCNTGTKIPAEAGATDVSLLQRIAGQGLEFSEYPVTQTLRAEAWLYRYLHDHREQLSDPLLNLAFSQSGNTALMPLYETEVSLSARDFQSAGLTLATIAPSNDYEGNTQTTLLYKMIALQQGAARFTADELDLIALVAVQCPRAGGPAVYVARTLYALAHPESFWTDDCESEDSLVSAAEPGSTSSRWILFPNPATDRVTLLHSEGGALTVSDLQGRILIEMSVPGDVPATELDITTLASGMYLICILPSTGGVQTEKMVIQR